MSRAERDAAYNNSLAVADAPALRERREAASAAARLAAPAKLDLRYGPAPRMLWDLFPAQDRHAPCLVFIHGGYWQMNSKDGFPSLMDGVRAHGWAAALPGYTLAPETSIGGIVAEIDTALDWLATYGPGHGIAGPVVVSGWSAGGHLAALALAHRAVRAGLAISGVFELGPLRDTYLNEKLRLSDEDASRLSPLRLPPVAKPLAIAYGTAELPALVRDSRRLHLHRAAAHAPGPLLPVAGADHFTVLDALSAKDGVLTRQVLTLL